MSQSGHAEFDKFVTDNDAAPGALGSTRDNPILAPFTEEDGIPYGAFCKCGRCGFVGRSTVSFDYYNRADHLVCETCQMADARSGR